MPKWNCVQALSMSRKMGTDSTLSDAMRLFPDPDTNTYNRSRFLIHGDTSAQNNTASTGCIIFNRNQRNMIANSDDNRLRVIP